ncbi:MAG: single-stranded-DNA-specific exonuclease RecJ [Clostridiales bacterium]|nr:single-stranded-DNA-specific exonuclease RecJ [Clostridiales bacterium]
MQKQWVFPIKEDNKDILISLLEKRGIIGQESVEEFLSDRPQLTHDPFLMKDMKEASDRILAALDKHEHICIYGDYDADGVCGVSLMIEILGKLNADLSYYIPSRFEEGYGLNQEAIAKIKDRGTHLIITVDCGSVSYDEVEYAKELGMDVIVTDHHNLNDKPASCLLINPKQEDCPYPEKGLSGCGVAFKLAQALQRKLPKKLTKADLNKMLDLVAIATVGDIVPLTGENRTMVKYGIRVINSGKRSGLSMLIKGAGLKDGEINSENIAYVIVPHLNAAGRMLSARTGVKLLTADTEQEWKEAANCLLENNRERKRIQDIAFEEAVAQIDECGCQERFLILDLPNAHEGITGIVAGKIKDKYNLPTIIVTPTGENKLKGTGRSIEGLDLYEMLSACSHLFDKFGGHAGACGFTMDSANLQVLREALCTSAESRYRTDPLLFQSRLNIDIELEAEELKYELISCIEKFEPYGHKNSKPIIAIRGVSLSGPCYMGDRQQHVRFYADGVSCILFNRADEFREYYEQGRPVDIAGYPEINRWNGSEKIQFMVIDLR